MRRLTPLLLVLLLSVPATTPAQTEDVIRIEPTPKLTVYRSKHYRVHTPLSRDEVLPYARHMDALFKQYDARFGTLVPAPVEPMSLYLFETQQQYDRFLQEHDIDATHSGGMFFVTHKLRGLATWAEAGNRRKTFEVLQHEGFHQFAWHTFGPDLPVWVNEGLAQYFESAVLRDGKLSLGMIRRPRIEKVRTAIREGDALPIEQLMAVSGKQWAQRLRDDPEHAGLSYAQSWSLVFYLIHGDGGKHKQPFTEYLKRLSQGDSHGDAQLMAFGQSGMIALEEDWQRYALRQQPNEVAEAIERLEFLGTGLRLLAEQGEAMPDDLDALRDTLQRYGFKLRRSEMGVTRHLSADEDEMYRFEREAGDTRAFVLLKPARAGLPPRITAPGLEPEPTLIWTRDADGKLVQDIAYD
ncbi:MAG: DUF1570 domain-containing protein [Phycisphaeraceae bacterium]